MEILKPIVKFFLVLFLDIFAKYINNNSFVQSKTILLIRVDAIGDYVLFRNFIKTLRNKYKDYEITLVGNIAWKQLAEELDSEYIDKFVWINRKRFERNPFYRFKKLREISQKGYEIVINPTYSRTFYCDDAIVNVVSAKEKIGNIGDLSNIKKWQKSISDKYYTNLIPAKNEIIFEFYRNKEFFENLFNKKLDIKKPFIKLKPKKLHFELPEKYAILFIGASAKFRKWHVKNFAKVGKFLKENYGYEIVLCGAPSDIEDANEFRKYAKYNYIDLVGRTSLIDLLYVIYNGDLMIANETSAPHFAVALEIANIFVISNGNHFGRFTPYPKEITVNYYPIYHPEIEKNLDDYKKLSNSYGYGSKLDINDINADMVIKKIKEVLG